MLSGLESQSLIGYIPKAGSSGVTIATGFDLGQHDVKYIKSLRLPKSLEAKLLPFAGSKDIAAAKNLKISAQEAKLIDSAVINRKVSEFEQGYRKAFGTDPSQNLDEGTKLALASAHFNMGNKIFDAQANPKMVKALKSNNAQQIQKEIANFHKGKADQPESRRLAEAAIASGFIDPNDFKAVTNFRDLMANNPEARKAYQQNWGNWGASDQQLAKEDFRKSELVAQKTKPEKPWWQTALESVIPSANAEGLDTVGSGEGLKLGTSGEGLQYPQGKLPLTFEDFQDHMKRKVFEPEIPGDTVDPEWAAYMDAIRAGDVGGVSPTARITEPIQVIPNLQSQRIPEVVVDAPQPVYRDNEIRPKSFMGEPVAPQNIWRDSQGNPILDRFGGYIYQKQY